MLLDGFRAAPYPDTMAEVDTRVTGETVGSEVFRYPHRTVCPREDNGVVSGARDIVLSDLRGSQFLDLLWVRWDMRPVPVSRGTLGGTPEGANRVLIVSVFPGFIGRCPTGPEGTDKTVVRICFSQCLATEWWTEGRPREDPLAGREYELANSFSGGA